MRTLFGLSNMAFFGAVWIAVGLGGAARMVVLVAGWTLAVVLCVGSVRLRRDAHTLPRDDSPEETKAPVRRFMEARARADPIAIEEMLAPDFISYGSRSGQQSDREGYRRQVAESVTALSDVRFVIEDRVAQGDPTQVIEGACAASKSAPGPIRV